MTELKPQTWTSSVSRMLKVTIVLLCFSLCGAGIFIVSVLRDEKSQRGTNMMPVKNRQAIQRHWLQV